MIFHSGSCSPSSSCFLDYFLGVYPQPFFERIEVSINHYIEMIKNQEPRFAQKEAESSGFENSLSGIF
ncbi:MAG: hypothetical protein Ct9H300mP21_07190 [Pseudomonadota bacterium]|nr:MAG: hypothetical protein Ct9H300mP21_07190 [Pseudomonadota bacterium]